MLTQQVYSDFLCAASTLSSSLLGSFIRQLLYSTGILLASHSLVMYPFTCSHYTLLYTLRQQAETRIPILSSYPPFHFTCFSLERVRQRRPAFFIPHYSYSTCGRQRASDLGTPQASTNLISSHKTRCPSGRSPPFGPIPIIFIRV